MSMRSLLIVALLAGTASADPADFTHDAQIVFRVAACAHLDQPLPAELWAKDPKQQPAYEKVVAAHCKQLAPYMEKFRTDFYGKARAWLAEHMPKDLPKTIVYPFGGGDLISVFTPFPDPTEVTTLSLELAGDPRHIAELTPAQLEADLYKFRTQLGPVLGVGSNSSVNLSAEQQLAAVPGQLASHLVGLATAGFEITGLRYFTIADDGSLKYLTQADIDGDTKHGKSLRGNWKSPRFAQSFANAEVHFRKPGDTTDRIHRHIGWNLADDNLKTHGEVIKHLAAKGKVTMMTKGASYLLWLKEFDTMRHYLADHMVWMISDSTGIPPDSAKELGLVQEAFGLFSGPLLDQVEHTKHADAARALWKNAPPVPFRYGYLDHGGRGHLMFTHPK